jgi:hypothetical protein
MGGMRERDGVNLTEVHCKHIWKCHSDSPTINKNAKIKRGGFPFPALKAPRHDERRRLERPRLGLVTDALVQPSSQSGRVALPAFTVKDSCPWMEHGVWAVISG